MPRILGIDLETLSSALLPKCGLYRYSDSQDFEILLFSYAYDDEPVQTVDMACGEQLPPDVLAALDDSGIIKCAYNAQFERVCLSRYLGHRLDPHQWRCTAVMAAYLTLPARLADVAVALNVTKKKMEEGKDLIRYFSVPCKPTKTNDGRTRNLPKHAPEKWATYKAYNVQDVETERAVRKALEAYPMPDHEWELYALDIKINCRGVRVDRLLVKQAMAVDQAFSAQAFLRAQELTGLDNPGSVSKLKIWLADQDMPMESLAKKTVQEKAKDADGIVGELLNLRLELSKTSMFLSKAFSYLRDAMAKDASIYVFYATAKARVFHDAYEDAGFKVGAGLVWKKDRLVLTRTDWKYNHEPLIWGWRKDGKHIWYGNQAQTTVFEFARVKSSKTEGCGHPSSKPVPLIAYLIEQCTQSNGLVLDGFLGSASTLVACEQLNRVCFGIEMEPKFMDVAVKRYAELMGSPRKRSTARSRWSWRCTGR